MPSICKQPTHNQHEQRAQESGPSIYEMQSLDTLEYADRLGDTGIEYFMVLRLPNHDELKRPSGTSLTR